MGYTLVCTLGTSAPVIPESVRAMKSKWDIVIDRLVILHTTYKDVFAKTIKITENQSIDIGLNAYKEYHNAHFKNIELVSIQFDKDDIQSEEDNQAFLKLLMDTLFDENKGGNKVYISIAGGRKTMSSLAVIAGYLTGCEKIFHVILIGDEIQLTKEYDFSVPEHLINVAEIPMISLSPLLNTLSSGIDGSTRLSESLFSGGKLSDFFTSLNLELANDLKIRKWRNIYIELSEKYLRLCQTVSAILSNYAKDACSLKPEVTYRVKTFESMLEKITRKQNEKKPNAEEELIIENPFTSFADIAGIRMTCYSKEDVENMHKMLTNIGLNDLEVIPDQKFIDYGYKAWHYDAHLTDKRIQLDEYKDLKGLTCEIQIKTLFSHAWSQIEHRLIYKSTEFKSMNEEQRKAIMDDFTGLSLIMNQAEEQVSRIKKKYP